MPRRYVIHPDGTKEYLPDAAQLDSPQGPVGPLLEQRNVAQRAMAGPIKPPMEFMAKMASDIGFGVMGAGLGTLGGPVAPITIPLGAAAGQYVSDTIFGTPNRSRNINTAIAFAAPVVGEALAVSGGQLGGISKGTIKDTMIDAYQNPVKTAGGLRTTRPVVGLPRGAEGAMADKLDTQLLAEETGPFLPLSRAQASTSASILDKYRGLAHLNPQQVDDVLRNTVAKGQTSFTPEVKAAQDAMNKIADKATEVAKGRGGYLDLTDVEELLDQLRQPTNFAVEGGSARTLAYKSAQGEIDSLIRKQITDPDDLKLYNQTKAAMKARLDARDALRGEVGKLIPEPASEDFYKGMNAFIRRINQPGPQGEVADKVIKSYDLTHGTSWFKQIKRLNMARQWSPDDRNVARSIWSIFRTELSLAGIPFATKVATEGVIAAPVVGPPVREYIKSQFEDQPPNE